MLDAVFAVGLEAKQLDERLEHDFYDRRHDRGLVELNNFKFPFFDFYYFSFSKKGNFLHEYSDESRCVRTTANLWAGRLAFGF